MQPLPSGRPSAVALDQRLARALANGIGGLSATTKGKDMSPAMVAALLSYADGRPWAHLSGRSMHGGAYGTVYALSRRGLFDPVKYELTPDGWMEARALAAQRDARRR